MASDTCACAAFFLSPSLFSLFLIDRKYFCALFISLSPPLSLYSSLSFILSVSFIFFFFVSSLCVHFLFSLFRLSFIFLPSIETILSTLKDHEKRILCLLLYAHASGCHIDQEEPRDIQLECQQRTGMSLADYPWV